MFALLRLVRTPSLRIKEALKRGHCLASWAPCNYAGPRDLDHCLPMLCSCLCGNNMYLGIPREPRCPLKLATLFTWLPRAWGPRYPHSWPTFNLWGETKETLASEIHCHSWWNNPLILVYLGISKFSHWNFCILGAHPALDRLGHCPSWCPCIQSCAVWCGRNTEGCPYWSNLQSRRLFWKTGVSVKYLSLHTPIHCGCVGTRPAGRCPGSYCVNTNRQVLIQTTDILGDMPCPSNPIAI